MTYAEYERRRLCGDLTESIVKGMVLIFLIQDQPRTKENHELARLAYQSVQEYAKHCWKRE